MKKILHKKLIINKLVDFNKYFDKYKSFVDEFK
jgi:hypothetical protein